MSFASSCPTFCRQSSHAAASSAPSNQCRIHSLRTRCPQWHQPCSAQPAPCRRQTRRCAKQTEENPSGKPADPEVTTEKYGLEAGLWSIFASKDAAGAEKPGKGAQAKQLLAQYGSAYLITSISFALVSFAACYALVSSGVDVSALLSKVGIQVNTTSERVGTFAIAYAAHKALSPVRFPPTVALTPVVAKYIGSKKSDKEANQAD